MSSFTAPRLKRGDSIADPPRGPTGTTLHFGSLRAAEPEIVADATVGTHVGDCAPEPLVLRRLAWVLGLAVDDQPALRAKALAYFDLGLVRAVLVDGARHWQRVRARRMGREERERARLRAAQLAAEDATFGATSRHAQSGPSGTGRWAGGWSRSADRSPAGMPRVATSRGFAR